jgi:hypothetical protein
MSRKKKCRKKEIPKWGLDLDIVKKKLKLRLKSIKFFVTLMVDHKPWFAGTLWKLKNHNFW